MCKFILVTLFVICALHPSAFAQSESKVSLQFISFPIQADPEPVELALSDGKTMMVDLPCSRFSEPYRVPRLSSWTVGKTVENKEKKSVFQPYASVKSSASASQLVLLLRKGEDNSSGFHAILVDMDPGKFKGGGFYFVNASNTNIGVLLGDKKTVVIPGKTAYLKPKPNVGGILAQVGLATQEEEEWKMFSETRWVVHPKRRTITFFYQQEGSDRLKQHTIGGFIP